MIGAIAGPRRLALVWRLIGPAIWSAACLKCPHRNGAGIPDGAVTVPTGPGSCHSALTTDATPRGERVPARALLPRRSSHGRRVVMVAGLVRVLMTLGATVGGGWPITNR